MASSSAIHRGVGTGPPAAQPPAASTSAVVADVPSTSAAADEPDGVADISDVKWQSQGMPETDFNNRYPPDPWGEETAPHARVWKIYRDRENATHKGMLYGWNKTLDVLLIFAGLFSAVLTTFLIESYKALQPDYTQYVAAFLYAAAVSHSSGGAGFPALDAIVAPDRFVQTSTTQRWTNGLWFTSLALSLAVALLCILIKQWLDEYDSHVSSATASQKYWAKRHYMYHRGLRKWGVPVLISFLPLLLHLALFFFFVGLVLFLRPLDGAIAYSLLVLVVCMGAFYFLTLVLPVWYVECPSYTPLLEQALLAVSRVISGLLYVIGPQERPMSTPNRGFVTAPSDHATRVRAWLESIQLRAAQLFEREARAISKCDEELDGYVLSTLIHLPTDGNRDAINAAFASIGAVTSTRTVEVISRKVPHDVIEHKINHCFVDTPATVTGFAITSHAQLRRACGVLSILGSSHPVMITAAAVAPGDHYLPK